MVSSKKEKKGRSAPSTAILSAAAIIFCALLMSAMVSDGEKYATEDSVPVSITYTPPEKEVPSGFWDIFSSAISRLFFIDV